MKRVFAHIGFSMTLTLIVLNLVSVYVALIISIGLAIVLVASLVVTRFRQAIAVPLCLGSALFACFIFMFNYSFVVAPQLELANTEAQAEFYYVDIPQERNGKYSYEVKTVRVDNSNAPQNIKLRLSTDEEINAEPYQIVKASLKFSKLYDNAFDSRGSWSKNEFLYANADDVCVTENSAYSPFKWTLKLRQDVVSTLSNVFYGDVGALSVALVTGYKELISDELYSAFRISCTSHLIAVSGFHLTIVTAGLFFVLKLLKVDKRIISIVGLLFVLICVGLACFSKSVIRAGIMMTVLLIGSATSKRADTLNSLGLATALICLNPYAVTDIGAQLSVITTLALILCYNYVSGKYSNYVYSIAIPTVATLSNLPVMYLFFGYVSIIGMASNTIASPIGGISLVLSLLTYFCVKLNIFTDVVTKITAFVINLLIKIIKDSSTLSFSTAKLQHSFGLVLAGVFFLLAITFILKKKLWIKPVMCIAIAIVVAGVGYGIYENNSTVSMLVTENGAVAVVDRNKATVYGLHTISDNYSVYSFLYINGFNCKRNENGEILYGENVEITEDEVSSFNAGNILVSYDAQIHGNINIGDDFVYDDYGLINTQKGDIIYTIYEDSTYKANWVDAFGG